MLEMLVVLAILAALTMVAVQSLEPVERQARYEATRRTIDDLKKSLLAVNQSGNSTVVSGFVADMGYLPNLSSSTALVNDLAHNSGPTQPLFPVQGQPFGWHGPYLQTNLSSTQIVDGWGIPFSIGIFDATGTASKSNFTALTDRLIIASAGSATDPSTALATSIAATSFSATRLTVNLFGLDATGQALAITTTGASAPLLETPAVVLQGGVNPAGSIDSPTITTLTGSLAVNGAGYVCHFDPPFPGLLVGTFNLLVTVTPDTSNYNGYSTATRINLVPGTSPVIDQLIVRKK